MASFVLGLVHAARPGIDATHNWHRCVLKCAGRRARRALLVLVSNADGVCFTLRRVGSRRDAVEALRAHQFSFQNLSDKLLSSALVTNCTFHLRATVTNGVKKSVGAAGFSPLSLPGDARHWNKGRWPSTMSGHDEHALQLHRPCPAPHEKATVHDNTGPNIFSHTGPRVAGASSHVTSRCLEISFCNAVDLRQGEHEIA